ncbi:Protein of unknown function [Pseudovibrio denitrificans]|uniref:Lcl C-terminal domain-containing protein n=1 Tax=Pseudovibrio denitrificans TaxID=258256 RepID=A0A1I7D611_9HYPH|nr:DUF1566 domain-containing protein [Pseudovibrio denitrificans]SFU07106.1 Protein of unknown function [Pseudovibrio denitrificans]
MKKTGLSLIAATLFGSLTALPAHAQLDCANKPPLQERFTVNGALVKQTGYALEWKRCAEGMAWESETQTCTGEPLELTQDVAASHFAENTEGWRLPTIRELYGLLDSTCAEKEELHVIFPDLAAPAFIDYADFWSATGDRKLEGMYYYLDFVTYALDFHSQGYSLTVRAVRDSK